MFFTRKTLLATLYEAKKGDPECIQLLQKIKADIRDMELNEVSLKYWNIPDHIPSPVILVQAKKQNYACLRFSVIAGSEVPYEVSNGCKRVLQVYDYRPAENYKYGYYR